jgi:hypothetical protein
MSKKNKQKFPLRVKKPFLAEHRTGLDISPKIEVEEETYYQSLIGMLS